VHRPEKFDPWHPTLKLKVIGIDMPLRVQNRIQVQMHDPWMLVETTRVTELEYYFACTRKGVHLYFVISPGKMIFAVLEL